MRPSWHEVYGSAGRAASAMAALEVPVMLRSYADPLATTVLQQRAALEGFRLNLTPIDECIGFEYDHGLAYPRVVHSPMSPEPLVVRARRVVRFGLMEGDAIVHADQAVYDPQSPGRPRRFTDNGSTAKRLALVLNYQEAQALSGLPADTPARVMARTLIDAGQAHVVVIKQGPRGALVDDGHTVEAVPAYKSSRVWKIGSGDNFVAHFASRWLHEGLRPAEAADFASRATSYYCETRGFATAETLAADTRAPIRPSTRHTDGWVPQVYLAGPFFSLAQLWIVEQARRDLAGMGLKVFSPYHDVGHSSAEDVAQQDMEAIRKSDLLFAIGDGMDSGTLFEVGYARSMGRPVIFYSENPEAVRQKMLVGSDCDMVNDYVSAIYRAVWVACEL
ncbi:MAG: nucleoside 2-deoxyribosyltransferase [Betaproteobacteria bacterium]|nr:nucleoside 2-deoxyribosyltransferase [Betaproteobacteria bacterium]MBU6511751.1 nucleoside 2-deoxyribosyltransferase [Betaproteobacteria bacterium]MDE1954244.1 nucleoside 2-deoxyribosyltransferase [Betaproteobacteria bacterium]MDE2153301.1 nucleoside 2-deoxyribosyltransferase [Betaproteobacteria bacterium]